MSNVVNDTIIGERVTVGHAAVLEGCVVADDVLVGMNATVLDGVSLSAWSIVAAGAVVRENSQMPGDSLIAGVPAKVKAPLSAEMRQLITNASRSYLDKIDKYNRYAKPL